MASLKFKYYFLSMLILLFIAYGNISDFFWGSAAPWTYIAQSILLASLLLLNLNYAIQIFIEFLRAKQMNATSKITSKDEEFNRPWTLK